MNRTIKFRAWDGKRMLPNVGTHPNITMRHEGYSPEQEGAFTIGEGFSAYTLMQFTGLTDKNGVEIYEGDIVNYAEKKKVCPDCAKKDRASELNYGIDRFCKDCGKELTNQDFVTTRFVQFNNGGFAYCSKPKEEWYSSWQTQIAERYIAWVEIIGNIYEHPSLLQS